ncbi:MAG: hypothetical protein KF703_10900 [Actinobacteria bacterium]|nr:hypothetical protein [Actinomycetota bacterium]
MTSEPPSRPGRRPRPDPAFRRRALGLDGSGPAAVAAGGAGAAPAVTKRESLREALARIPDLDRDGAEAPVDAPAAAAAAPAPAAVALDVAPGAVDTVAVPEVDGRSASEAPADVSVEEPVHEPSPEPEAREAPSEPDGEPPSEPSQREPDVELDPASLTALGAAAEAAARGGSTPPPPRRGRRHPSPPPRPPWWRRLAFALAVVALVGAIPLLGRTGYRLVTESTDGKLGNSGAGPDDPGYEELVQSTPTALVVQKDAEGLPVALTFLSLSNGTEGGSVIFVPLDTAVTQPGFGVDRLRTSYTAVADDPVGATNQIASQTAKVLNVGIDEVIVLDDRGWSQLVAPVSPIAFDNPEPVDLASGTVPSGPVSMEADQVGPYLAARRDGESEQAALYRQQAMWKAWLAAVAASGRPDAVPGETGTGIGLFARTLAAGPVDYDNLPGEFNTPADGGLPRFEPDAGAVSELVVHAVPAPDSPFPGARTTVRVLNGVGPGDIPAEVIRDISSLNGSVTVVGNGPSFDYRETAIVYRDASRKDYALLLKARLGIEGEVRLDPTASDTVDLTVILGRDVLGDGPQTRSSSSTTTLLGAPGASGDAGSSTSSTTSTTEPLGGM